MGFQTKFLESGQPADYETNIDALAAEGYNVIITAGPLMGDATAMKAKEYPDITFSIVDNIYSNGGPAYVTSLMFSEGQVGLRLLYLQREDSSKRSLRAKLLWASHLAGTNIKDLNNYINIKTTDKDVPFFTDPAQGKETAQKLISQECDVVFVVGGNAVNCALLAVKENNLPAIGADVDQYDRLGQQNSS